MTSQRILRVIRIRSLGVMDMYTICHGRPFNTNVNELGIHRLHQSSLTYLIFLYYYKAGARCQFPGVNQRAILLLFNPRHQSFNMLVVKRRSWVMLVDVVHKFKMWKNRTSSVIKQRGGCIRQMSLGVTVERRSTRQTTNKAPDNNVSVGRPWGYKTSICLPSLSGATMRRVDKSQWGTFHCIYLVFNFLIVFYLPWCVLFAYAYFDAFFWSCHYQKYCSKCCLDCQQTSQ